MARILSHESHWSFSGHLSESALLQWFRGIRFGGVLRVLSKSTLQRMEAEVPAQVLQEFNVVMLHRSMTTGAAGASVIGLADAVDLSLIW